jgi:hypothetical protein
VTAARRQLPLAVALASALAAACPGAVAAAGPTAELTFSTPAPGASTALRISVDFSSQDAGGQQRALRKVVYTLPAGTAFDTEAAASCQASAAELSSGGLGACPSDSKVGEGKLHAVATKLPASAAGPLTVDITVFNASHPKDKPAVASALLIVSSSAGRVQSVDVAQFDANVLTVEPTPVCSTPGEQPPCPNGEFTVKDVDYTIAEHAGAAHRLITTPAGCPSDGRWAFDVLIDYRDGTNARTAASSPCTPATQARPRIELTVSPRTALRCRAARFAFTAIAAGAPVQGAEVRFANRRATTDAGGKASISARLCTAGKRRATVKMPGFRKGLASVRVAR